MQHLKKQMWYENYKNMNTIAWIPGYAFFLRFSSEQSVTPTRVLWKQQPEHVLKPRKVNGWKYPSIHIHKSTHPMRINILLTTAKARCIVKK